MNWYLKKLNNYIQRYFEISFIKKKLKLIIVWKDSYLDLFRLQMVTMMTFNKNTFFPYIIILRCNLFKRSKKWTINHREIWAGQWYHQIGNHTWRMTQPRFENHIFQFQIKSPIHVYEFSKKTKRRANKQNRITYKMWHFRNSCSIM